MKLFDRLAVTVLSRVLAGLMVANVIKQRAVAAMRRAGRPETPAHAGLQPLQPPAEPMTSLPKMTTVMPLLFNDGPLALVQRDASGQLYFGLWCDRDDQRHRWVYAPITPEMHARIVGGLVDTRDVLLAGDVIVVDEATESGCGRAWTLPGRALPDDYVPVAGVRFSAEDIVQALEAYPVTA